MVVGQADRQTCPQTVVRHAFPCYVGGVGLPFDVIWSLAAPPTRFPLTQQVAASAEATSAPSASSTTEEHLACLFDGKARIGSGMLVSLPDGDTAVLTARHVVLDLTIAGEFNVVIPALGWRSLEPRSFRVHPRKDLALVRLPAVAKRVAGIDWDQWVPHRTPIPTVPSTVLAGGLPGEWKGAVDLEHHTIAGIRALGVWSRMEAFHGTTEPFVLRADSAAAPRSFEGMSGGPVLSADGRLLGVITEESKEGPRRLHGAHLSLAADVVDPFQPPDDIASDLMRQVAAFIIPVRFADKTFHAFGLFEHFWSPTQAESSISRMTALGSTSTTGSLRLLMNTESIFYPRSHELGEQIAECREELRWMLSTTRIKPLEEGADPPAEVVALVTSLINDQAPNAGRITIMTSDRS